MRGKPLIPFAITAIIGILLMLSLSFVGLTERESRGEEGAEEEVVEFEDPIAAGEEMFQQSCIGCHGQDRLGVGGNPALNQVASKYDAAQIAEIIQKGQGNMPPMPHNQVEAEAIAEYLISVSE